jgi:putative membrane protein
MITLGIVVAALVYLRGWLRLRSTTNTIPAWRAGGFLVGLTLIWIAAASPIASCDEGSLTMHMVHHLLLMTMGPLLVFLGEPVLAFGHGLPQPVARAIVAHPFRWPPVQRAGRALGQPALCWLAATLTLVGWHVPAAFTLALHSHTWHAVEQASFLGTGLLFWWPVVQPWPSRRDPRWSIVLYLFLATLPCDILSGFLVFSDRVAYPAYVSTRSVQAVLDDQQRAGALMWTCVTIVYLVAGAIVSTQLLTPVPPASLQRAEVV